MLGGTPVWRIKGSDAEGRSITTTYLMFGRYNSDSVWEISSSRTDDVVGIVERFNGHIVSMYAMLGVYDLLFIVNLPGNQEALEVSVALNRATGVTFITAPSITVDRYDSLIKKELDSEAGDALDSP